MKPELCAKCRRLDFAVLKFLAAAHGLEVPPAITKDAIINLLTQNLNELQLEEALNEACFVHLTKAQSELRSMAEKAINTWGNEIQSKLEKSSEVLKERVDNAAKGLDSAKNFANWVAVIIGAIAAVGMIFSIFQTMSLQTMKNDVTKLKSELTGIAQWERRALLERVRYDFKGYLRDLALDLPDKVVLEKVRKDQFSLDELKHQMEALQENDDQKAEVQFFDCLARTADGLLSFEGLYNLSGKDILGPSSKAIVTWKNLDLAAANLITNKNYSSFAVELLAYSKNAQANLELTQYRIFKSKQPLQASNANERAFRLTEEAINLKRDFARPYINRNVCRKYDYQRERAGILPDVRELEKLEKKLAGMEREVQGDLDMAAELAESGIQRAAVFNNKADWCMLHANLLLEIMKLAGAKEIVAGGITAAEKARKLIDDSFDHLATVSGLIDKTPVIAITEAEIMAAQLTIKRWLNEPPFQPLSEVDSREHYRQIIGRFATASALRYKWEERKTDFLDYIDGETSLSILGVLATNAHLNVDYRAELVKVAAIKND
jgi:hypothetical protein